VSRRYAEGVVWPWLIGIPLAFLMALVLPRFIHQREHEPPSAATTPTTQAPHR
jgi:hypothetical protein